MRDAFTNRVNGEYGAETMCLSQGEFAKEGERSRKDEIQDTSEEKDNQRKRKDGDADQGWRAGCGQEDGNFVQLDKENSNVHAAGSCLVISSFK